MPKAGIEPARGRAPLDFESSASSSSATSARRFGRFGKLSPRRLERLGHRRHNRAPKERLKSAVSQEASAKTLCQPSRALDESVSPAKAYGGGAS